MIYYHNDDRWLKQIMLHYGFFVYRGKNLDRLDGTCQAIAYSNYIVGGSEIMLEVDYQRVNLQSMGNVKNDFI